MPSARASSRRPRRALKVRKWIAFWQFWLLTMFIAVPRYDYSRPDSTVLQPAPPKVDTTPPTIAPVPVLAPLPVIVPQQPHTFPSAPPTFVDLPLPGCDARATPIDWLPPAPQSSLVVNNATLLTCSPHRHRQEPRPVDTFLANARSRAAILRHQALAQAPRLLRVVDAVGVYLEGYVLQILPHTERIAKLPDAGGPHWQRVALNMVDERDAEMRRRDAETLKRKAAERDLKRVQEESKRTLRIALRRTRETLIRRERGRARAVRDGVPPQKDDQSVLVFGVSGPLPAEPFSMLQLISLYLGTVFIPLLWSSLSSLFATANIAEVHSVARIVCDGPETDANTSDRSVQSVETVSPNHREPHQIPLPASCVCELNGLLDVRSIPEVPGADKCEETVAHVAMVDHGTDPRQPYEVALSLEDNSTLEDHLAVTPGSEAPAARVVRRTTFHPVMPDAGSDPRKARDVPRRSDDDFKKKIRGKGKGNDDNENYVTSTKAIPCCCSRRCPYSEARPHDPMPLVVVRPPVRHFTRIIRLDPSLYFAMSLPFAASPPPLKSGAITVTQSVTGNLCSMAKDRSQGLPATVSSPANLSWWHQTPRPVSFDASFVSRNAARPLSPSKPRSVFNGIDATQSVPADLSSVAEERPRGVTATSSTPAKLSNHYQTMLCG